MTASLEQRLDATESRTAIADLVHTYARCIRYDRPDEVGVLFTEDGTFELREGHPDKPEYTVRYRLEGRASVHAHMAHNKGNTHPVPLIHNLIIAIDGDRASATSVMEGKVYGTSHGVIGEYHDSFRRENGTWLFAARIYTIFSAASTT
jgi:hypothetical protein